MNFKGFTFVEILVGISLLLIIFLGIYAAFQLGLKTVGQTRAKATAIALANQKIEQIRNLAYNDVGTIGGIPAGVIAQTEALNRNKIDFNLKTTVLFIDDPFDGLAPSDSLATDYKRARIRVSWTGYFGGELIMTTDIAPQGIETELRGGTLIISVFNAEGQGVSGADIQVVNDQVEPIINAFYQSDQSGKLIIAGAPSSTQAYQITVSKSGFNSDRTYGREEVVNPDKPHQSVFEGQTTEISFSIDYLSSFLVETREKDTEFLINNIDFHLQGLKIIGVDEQEEPVYKYSQDHNSGSLASILLENMEWDSYNFSTEIPIIELIETIPGPQPIDLLPASSTNIILYFRAENTLMINVLDSSTSQPVFGADVRLYNFELNYDNSRPSDESGQAYFIPLEQGEYNLEVYHPEYQTAIDTANVSGDAIKAINLAKP